jgi:hypothetical protein
MNDDRYMELLKELQEKVLKLQTEIDGLRAATDTSSGGGPAVEDLTANSQRINDILRLVQERQPPK